MKKIIVLFFLLICTKVYANNVVVESLSNVNKDIEPPSFSVKVLEDADLSEIGFLFAENDIIHGKITKRINAKRGKRNGYILIEPVSYVDSKTDVVHLIENENLEAKVVGYSKKDFKTMGLKAGLAVGGYFVKGLGQIFYFSKGLILPDDGKSRVSTAVHNVYESTPFVYIEKGKDINIEEGDYLVLKFRKKSKNENLKRQ